MSGGLPGGRHAAVIGINAYGNGIATLSTAVPDARAVAAALERDQGYAEPIVLLDEAASLGGIVELLERTLPALGLAGGGALVFYFAGHGVAFDDHEGPQGYLIPQGACSGEPATWLPMDRVRRALGRLPCRHLLVVLDCCFAGSFRWASSRRLLLPEVGPLYDSQYARYLEGEAWQVLTSASHQEVAQDVAPGSRNYRDEATAKRHSPFAAAFLEGLAGVSDSSRGEYGADGVITATELYQYIFERLVPAGKARRQTPGLWPLKPANTGEFIFTNPRQETRTRPDPPLDDADNPWLGLAAYSDRDAPLFFGRERVVRDLLGALGDDSRSPLLAVVGASGTGKSSVVKAGVLPRLRELAAESGLEWRVVVCQRLGKVPRDQLNDAVARLEAMKSPAAADDLRRLLVIDQFEELFTQGSEPEEQRRFLDELAALLAAGGLRVLITLRSDFEPRLADTPLAPWLEACGPWTRRDDGTEADDRRPGCFRVPPFSSDELRQAIEGPAANRAMYFEPPELVDRLVDEVMAMPGGLPLLSFALAEMYRRSVLRRRRSGVLDRSLNEEDYREVGGVVGSLHRRATELYDDAERDRREVIRRLFLRMVSPEGGRLARRRVEDTELEYAAPGKPEQLLVEEVRDTYVDARLLVADEGHIEPAHDTLVLAWEKLAGWLRRYGSQELERQVWRAAAVWGEARRQEGPSKAGGLLWSGDPRLPQVQAMHGELNRLERRFVAASVKRGQRRRNLFVARVAAAILGLAGLAVFAFYKAGVAEDEKEKAERQTRLAQEQKRRAQELGRAATASALLANGRVTWAYLTALELREPAEILTATAMLHEALATRVDANVLRHDSHVHGASFSPDGRRVLTHGEFGTRICDSVSGKTRHVLGDGSTRHAVWSPDGTRALTTSEQTARIWDADSGKELLTLIGHDAPVVHTAWSSDGARVLTASYDGTARLWDAVCGDALSTLAGHGERIEHAAWSPDGTRILTVSKELTVRIWDTGSGESLHTLDHSDDHVTAIRLFGPKVDAAWSPDGARVLTWDWTARIWAAGSGEFLRYLTGQDAGLAHAAWSPDGARVLTAAADGTARIWHADSGELMEILAGHGGPIRHAVWSPDGTYALTVSGETARIWDAASGRSLHTFTGHYHWLSDADWSPDGSRIVTASWDTTARIWRVAPGGYLNTLVDSRDSFDPAWSPDGTRVFAGSRGAPARIWDAGSGAVLQDLVGHAKRIVAAVWSPDGTRILTGSMDGTARIWDAESGASLHTLGGHDNGVGLAAWSPRGSRVLTTAYQSETVRIWHAETGASLHTLTGHGAIVDAIAWNPEGTRVLTGSRDRTARIWDAASGTELLTLGGHDDDVSVAAWSPDGTRVLTESFDKTVRIWDAASGASVHILAGSGAVTFRAAWSPDGTRVLAAVDGATARVWDADSGAGLQTLTGNWSAVHYASWSPDGTRILTQTSLLEEPTSRIWDAGSGEQVHARSDWRGPIAWSPDGTRVLTQSGLGLQIWVAGGTTYLQARIRASVRDSPHLCLPADVRRRSLGETPAEAERQVAACEACVPGFFKRLEGVPQGAVEPNVEAWGEYRRCLGRKTKEAVR